MDVPASNYLTFLIANLRPFAKLQRDWNDSLTPRADHDYLAIHECLRDSRRQNQDAARRTKVDGSGTMREMRHTLSASATYKVRPDGESTMSLGPLNGGLVFPAKPDANR